VLREARAQEKSTDCEQFRGIALAPRPDGGAAQPEPKRASGDPVSPRVLRPQTLIPLCGRRPMGRFVDPASSTPARRARVRRRL
jgi:hypothetical protein